MTRGALYEDSVEQGKRGRASVDKERTKGTLNKDPVEQGKRRRAPVDKERTKDTLNEDPVGSTECTLNKKNAEKTEKKRNNSIELLRFLFTAVIIFFHINLDLWDQDKVIAVIRGVPVTFFMHGNLAVEFFFLVTGYLLARSVHKKIQEDKERPGTAASLPRETLQFIVHKAKAVLPCYLAACALTPAARLIAGKKLGLSYFLKRLPSLFFLQRLGLGRPFIGCTWYLSSLFIALPFVYPLCRKYYRAYTRVVSPLLCAVLLWSIISLTGSLGDIDDWFFFTYKTNIRAFAEISMGTTAYELSRFIRGRVHSLPSRAVLTFTALACLALSIMYMCSAADGIYGLPVFYLLFFLIAITFSGEGLISRADIFRSSFFTWLGSVSLPMYVTQTLLRMVVPCVFGKCSQWTQCFLIYAGTLFLAAGLLTAVSYVKSRSLPVSVYMPRRHATE